MPKQIHNIQAFHGGLSNNSDPRDIDNTEMSTATDVMVDEVGKIRTMGGTTAHDAGTSTAIAIEPGYGLFHFSHDRINGHLGEHLANTGDFSSNWTRTDDFAVDSTDATYTDSANAGTLIQTAANRLEKGVANVTYAFTYTISNFTETITLFRIKGSGSQFAAADTNLEQSNGTHTTTFTSHATDPDQPFTIDVTSGSSGTFNIDNVSLRIHDPAETGDDYLALADDESSDPAVYIYSKNKNAWSETQTITLGTSDNPKTSFYSVDGAIRISDGNFGTNNVNKWYGYIDRTLFKDLTPSYEINQWYEALQEVRKPSSSFFDDNATFSGAYGSIDTTTIGDTTTDFAAEARATINGNSVANVIKAEVGWTIDVAGEEGAPTDMNMKITCGVYEGGDFTSTSSIQTVLSGWQEGGTYDGTATFYFDAVDTVTGTGGPHGDWDTFRSEFTIDTGDESHGITAMRLYESGILPDLSGTRELSNNNVYMDFDWETNVGASGWNEGGAGKWEVGVSFIYDGLQESQITTCTDTADGTTTAISVPGSDTTSAPNLRIYFSDWNTSVTRNGAHWNKRISGCNLYMRDVSSSTEKSWFLQVSMDFETGKALVASTQKEFDALYYAQSNAEYYYFDIGSVTGVADESEMLEPSLVTTYEVMSGQNALEESIISQYRSAVVVGRRVYIGGLMVEKAIDGSREIMTDAMIKSPVNNFDIFPLSRMVEASVQDGDEIIKLEEYADRILQFKKNKMHIINISQEIEFLEETFLHKGVSHPAAVCKTDFGVAWVNNLGCYLYDGQKVHNLLEKGGRQIIKESEWATFTTNEPMIGYLPKKRQLLVANDVTTTGDGSTFLYDMVTQSWVKGAAATITSEDKTNFVTDWNGDLVYVHSTGTVLKWDDASDASNAVSAITKDIDFGQPGVRKKVYRVYVTYKGATDTNMDVFFDVNGGTALNKTFANGTNFTSSQLDGSSAWAVAELKPTTSSQANNIKSFRLKFVSNGNTPADFEINDISLSYRLKHIK